jgi:UDP-N-acetylglucosamine--N-acetylmuramyl-(pentapeptide) pyrophosphoryl-undecaprenol N-acetylglucosamine transferase
MEEQLVPKAGFELKCLEISGMSRGKSLSAVKKNLKAVSQTMKAVNQCKKIIREFGADAIIGTGGYACYPALKAGTLLKVPTCVHESNAMPGLTTRMLADKVSRMLICFPESAKHYKHPEKVETVGMPIRREFVYTDKAAARKELGLGDEMLVVSAFGSLGAKKMNEAVAEMLSLEKADGFPFKHIHATGKFGWEWMPDKVKEFGIDTEKCPNLDMREYIYNMPTVMAAADVFISRAGASSCNEIAASGTPAILIPSPNVTDNHQEKNARVLADRGGAVLLLERDCTANVLYNTVNKLLTDQKCREQMSIALRKDVILDSAERICDILDELTRKS